MAVKFHPDKNKSKHANDAFKKISHIFQVLSNDEKRAFYDQYGPEEEVRQRMHRQQQQYYEYDDQDPFEVFRMFFGGMDGHFEFRDGRLFRQQQARRRQQQQQQQREPVNRLNLIFSQLLPLILVFLIYVVPYLFQSVSVFLI